MYIYKITNLITNKIYVGQTTKSLRERFKRHCEKAYYSKGNLSYLHQSIKKYKKENFKIEILEKTKDLNNKEKFYINKDNKLGANYWSRKNWKC